MKIFKKITALVLAVSVVFSVTACADTRIAATIDGKEVTAGQYIYFVRDGLNEASTKYSEDNPDVDTSAEDFDITKQNVGGVPYSDFVKAYTLDQCKKFIAIERLFNEEGLSFTKEETDTFNKEIKSIWDDENQMLQYYGIKEKTMGEYYEKMGIARASYAELYINEQKKNKIFEFYYKIGGKEGITEADLTNYVKENYSRTRYIELKHLDGDGDTTADQAILDRYKTAANDYVKRLNGGEDFAKVELDAKKLSHEISTANDTEHTHSNDEFTIDQEKTDYDTFIQKDSEFPTEDVVKKAFEMPATGVYELVEENEAYYVICRFDVLERDDFVKEKETEVMSELKAEEFDAKLLVKGNTYNVSTNAAAVSAYSPEKLKELK